MGLPLTSTELTPEVMIPPPEFLSPFLCTAGIVYPMSNFFETGLIPVVASM
jgi:hypothetical protein